MVVQASEVSSHGKLQRLHIALTLYRGTVCMYMYCTCACTCISIGGMSLDWWGGGDIR